MLERGNNIPDYMIEAEAAPVPLSTINADNWLALCHDYKRRFTLEKQFRRFYVDYFLRELSDDGITYSECRVKKLDSPNAFADNVIMLCEKYIPVEVKLNINSEAKLFEQLESYCNAEAIFSGRIKLSDSGMLHRHSVIVIDTEAIYLYETSRRS